MKDFRDLQVWHKAHSMTLDSYRSTVTFPRQETYGLVSQIRRCAVSVAANIAEGCGKHGNAEFQRMLNMSAGCASELEYYFLLARDLEFLPAQDYERLNNHVVEVKKMLAGLMRKIEAERFAS